MICCPHYSRRNPHHGQCALGRHHGRPFAGQCRQCLNNGDHTRLSSLRPGNLLAQIIQILTKAAPCPTCQTRKKTMNTWGWIGCFRHRREILAWLTQAARDRGHKIRRATYFSIIKAAAKEGWTKITR